MKKSGFFKKYNVKEEDNPQDQLSSNKESISQINKIGKEKKEFEYNPIINMGTNIAEIKQSQSNANPKIGRSSSTIFQSNNNYVRKTQNTQIGIKQDDCSLGNFSSKNDMKVVLKNRYKELDRRMRQQREVTRTKNEVLMTQSFHNMVGLVTQLVQEYYKGPPNQPYPMHFNDPEYTQSNFQASPNLNENEQEYTYCLYSSDGEQSLMIDQEHLKKSIIGGEMKFIKRFIYEEHLFISVETTIWIDESGRFNMKLSPQVESDGDEVHASRSLKTQDYCYSEEMFFKNYLPNVNIQKYYSLFPFQELYLNQIEYLFRDILSNFIYTSIGDDSRIMADIGSNPFTLIQEFERIMLNKLFIIYFYHLKDRNFILAFQDREESK